MDPEVRPSAAASPAEGVVGAVRELWRFPVKSMQGTRQARLALTANSVAGDRGYAVVDVLVRAVGRVVPAAWHGGPTHSFICGPPAFTAVVDVVPEQLGVPPARRQHESFQVGPAAVAEGWDVPYSCLSGVCGSCAVRVLDGAVAPHAPDVLTEERDRAGWVLACQAAPAPP